MTDTKHDELMKIGRNAMASIREMVAALECDYNRLQELWDERDGYDEHDDECGQSGNWALDNPDEAAELAELEEAAGDCKDQDDARTRIEEGPLSLEFRSGWVTDKTEMVAEEFCLLLTTGGPAVRILGDLNDGQATRSYLQVQDWGTAWTDYYEDGIGEVLMTYVNVFCFE